MNPSPRLLLSGRGNNIHFYGEPKTCRSHSFHKKQQHKDNPTKESSQIVSLPEKDCTAQKRHTKASQWGQQSQRILLVEHTRAPNEQNDPQSLGFQNFVRGRPSTKILSQAGPATPSALQNGASKFHPWQEQRP